MGAFFDHVQHWVGRVGDGAERDLRERVRDVLMDVDELRIRRELHGLCLEDYAAAMDELVVKMWRLHEAFAERRPSR